MTPDKARLLSEFHHRTAYQAIVHSLVGDLNLSSVAKICSQISSEAIMEAAKTQQIHLHSF